jgi:hypothetical protein
MAVVVEWLYSWRQLPIFQKGFLVSRYPMTTTMSASGYCSSFLLGSFSIMIRADTALYQTPEQTVDQILYMLDMSLHRT